MSHSSEAPRRYSDPERTQVLLKGEAAALRFLSPGLRKYLFSVLLGNRVTAEAVCHRC